MTGFNLLADVDKDKELLCNAKFRYRQKDNPVKARFLDNDEVYLEFREPVKAVTEGQQGVLYLDDVMIGGGVIDKTYYEGRDKKEILKSYLE